MFHHNKPSEDFYGPQIPIPTLGMDNIEKQHVHKGNAHIDQD